ncbi:hypothetical protein GCM10007170_36020 [Arthrobacter liuii]|uniref:Uncharacterized protein n=1 Tax=Arthrobacter liuii TaxID=1476996 RepID=A0ABQ2AZR0_9MICC|nr:hypothetical protein GCM10007170_36020 [Arthrobacter liuii]
MVSCAVDSIILSAITRRIGVSFSRRSPARTATETEDTAGASEDGTGMPWEGPVTEPPAPGPASGENALAVADGLSWEGPATGGGWGTEAGCAIVRCSMTAS